MRTRRSSPPPALASWRGGEPEYKALGQAPPWSHLPAQQHAPGTPLVCRLGVFAMGYVTKLTPRQRAYVQRFEDAELKYFFSLMAKSNLTRVIPGRFAYQLEIPVEFLKAYGSEFTANCTVECKSRDKESTKQWPLGITVRYFRTLNKVRAFAYGADGWKQFFTDNKVGLGDLVVFQLIDYSRFQAYILPRIPALRPKPTPGGSSGASSYGFPRESSGRH